MPSLVWTRTARLDLVRLHAFLSRQSPGAAKKAIRTIQRSLKILETHPEIGRPTPELASEFREWFIEFGHGGYVALYRYNGDDVFILAIRHGREAGY